MISWIKQAGIVVAILLLFACMASAAPTIGAATGITSNSATFPIAGSSGETMVMFGQYSGYEIWWSANYTSPTNITVQGAPLLGNTKYYAKACDDTGCGNEVSWTVAAITPVPTRQFDASMNSIYASHWDLGKLGGYVVTAYTGDIPATILFGFIFGAIILGFWRKTKRVRLVGIMFMILSPMLLLPTTGLMLGMPLVMQSLGAVLFAVGFAGIVLSFIKK